MYYVIQSVDLVGESAPELPKFNSA